MMTNPSDLSSFLQGMMDDTQYVLSELEQDALGELGNICMGTSATTLSTLLGRKVSITTPHVRVARSMQDLEQYQKPYVAVEVSYISGVDGYNILLMKNEDVVIITDILMGGDGNVAPGTQIGELQLSAISEVMNQMVGSASTALSSILMVPVNISPPRTRTIVLEEEAIVDMACADDVTIAINFSMEIEGILKSELMQILPFDFGKKMANVLLSDMNASSSETVPPPPPAPPEPPAPKPEPVAPRVAPPAQHVSAPQRPAAPLRTQQDTSRVGVKAMQYPSFDEPATSPHGNSEYDNSLNLILDVPLQVTVELGMAKKSIKEILALTNGSVIVLDKLAGEMVDVLVNGRLYARGEVVVIDDNYGVRVTEIVSGSQGGIARTKNLFEMI
jgi:flagellar motor switch protein FliN/FliY